MDRAEYQREWQKKNPEKRKQYQTTYKNKNPNATKEAWFKYKYGISLEEKKTILQGQDYRCAICKTDTPKGLHKEFHLDHCHETNKIRGFLCDPCNRGLGLLGDSKERLQAALLYLERASN